MTIDDRAIERALTALADEGYPTSATDVDRAYQEFRARTARAEQRRRTTRLAIAAGVAGILGIGGLLAYQQALDDGRGRLQPATPTTSATTSAAGLISAEELVGIWSVEADWLYSGFPWLWTFNADGSGTGSPNADTTENTWGYTLRGNRIDARDRPPGCTYAWQVARYDQGALSLDIGYHCGAFGPGIALTRLSPASPAGEAIAMPPMTDASPLRDVDDVGGVWLMQGTGMLLAIEARDATNVTYRLDDKAALARDPIDLGTVSLDARGSLTLVSDMAAPAGCTAEGGPRITMTDVVVTELGFEARQGVEAVCVDAALTNAWVRVAAR